MPNVKANLKKITYCINFHSEGGKHDKNSNLHLVEHQKLDGQKQLCQIHASLLLKDSLLTNMHQHTRASKHKYCIYPNAR